MRNTSRLALLGIALGLLALTGWRLQQATTEDSTPEVTTSKVEVENATFRVNGPHMHDNLSVFLILSSKQDERNFLTLDEGLTKGLVKITEQEQESVHSLDLDNQSDRPLYLQEGERLQGGKQDRTIASSMVIPPHSGKTSVATFCIEQSRWQEGDSGKKFAFTLNNALAPKGVRGAAKFEGNQLAVWRSVSALKVTGSAMIYTPNTTSSVNELVDSPQVQRISDDYSSPFSALLTEHRDAVGVAIAINGQIEEVNVYPNHALLTTFFSRLIRSYGLQATMLKDLPKANRPPTSAQVAQLLRGGEVKSTDSRKIDSRNELQLREFPGKAFCCKTRYEGAVMHWQVMKKLGAGEGIGGICTEVGADFRILAGAVNDGTPLAIPLPPGTSGGEEAGDGLVAIRAARDFSIGSPRRVVTPRVLGGRQRDAAPNRSGRAAILGSEW